MENEKQQRARLQLNNALANMFPLIDELIAEMSDAIGVMESTDESNYSRRSYIRTFVTLIEAYSYSFLEQCRAVVDIATHAELTCGEKRLVHEDRAKGTSDRIKKSLKITSKIFDQSIAFDFGSSYWGNVTKLVNRRDRLTHPKKKEDLLISDEEWEKHWYTATYLTLYLTRFSTDLHNKFSGD